MTEVPEIKIDMEKSEKWLKSGAQPTDRVRSILKAAAAMQSTDVSKS